MKRLTDINLNEAHYFDKVWALEGIHRYDAVRLRALLEGMDKDKSLLDVGAGLNGAAQYATQHGYPGRYTALDFSEEARRRTMEITPTLDYQIGDARAMPFSDGAFDVVSCGELIEHMESPANFVAELVRVCKPGGRVIISTLIAECDAAVAHGVYPEHLWSFTPGDLVGFFAPYGPTKYWEVGHYHFVACIVAAKEATL